MDRLAKPLQALALLTLLSAATHSAGCGAAVGGPASAAATQDPAVHLGLPPKELWPAARRAGWEAGDLTAVLHADTPDKALVIHWRHRPSGAALEQRIALAYYPTTAILLAPGTLLVGEKNPRGATLVQAIDFQPPSAFAMAGGGTALVANPITAIRTLYDESTPRRDMVRRLVVNRADPGRAFIWFADSSDLYSLELDTELLELVASPQAEAGALHIPDLADPFTRIWARNHAALGFVYVFDNEFAEHRDPLVLMDTNRDGQLDSFAVTDGPTWVSLGLDDPQQYLE